MATVSTPAPAPPAGMPAPTIGSPAEAEATTPSRLRRQSIVIVVACLVAAVLGGLAVTRQSATTEEIAEQSEPTIVGARRIQTYLAEANAAAATAFVSGSIENPAKRAVFEASLASATAEIEATARSIGNDDESHEAMAAINVAVARYSGLIESARANNRQGFPVGAAYLDEATTVLETEVYPRTDLIANRAANDYLDSYNTLRSIFTVLALVAAGAVAVICLLLIVTHQRLSRQFRRSINPPLAVATLLALVLAGWMAFGAVSHEAALSSARVDGYEGVRRMLDLRGVAFGAQTDEARYLIARGAGREFEDDFQRRVALLNDRSDDFEFDGQVYQAWTRYADAHDELVTAELAGNREVAIDLAVGSNADLFESFDQLSASSLASYDEVFTSEMEAARSGLRGLSFGGPLLLAAIALLAAYGLQLRINEYR